MSGRVCGFIHCSLAHGGIWRPLLAELGDAVDPVVIELQGHGRAPDWNPSREISEQTIERALAALPERAVPVVGHSYGAVIALRLAIEHPERVASLVLAESVHFALIRGTPEFDALMAHFGPFDTPRPDREAAARAFMEVWGDGRDWASLPEDKRRYFADRIDLIAAAWGVQVEDRPGLLAPGRVEAVDVPVLLIEGGATDPSVHAVTDALEARLPDARRLVIPGAGHMAPITHAAIAAPAIRSHLARWKEDAA